MSRKFKALTIIISTIIFALLCWFMVSGDNYKLINTLYRDDLTGDEFKEILRSFGIRGSITLSLLSMFQVILTFLPAEPVQVLSGITYGIWQGALICLLGVFLGNTIIFILFKFFGNKLSQYFEKNIDVEFDKIKNTKRLAIVIFLLYFLPAIPYGLICFFTASMQIKYPRYIFLTTIGAIPSILIGVSLGHVAISTSWIVSLIIFIIIIAIIIVVAIKRKALFEKVNRLIAKIQKEHTTDTVVRSGNIFWTRIFAFLVRIWVRPEVKFTCTKNVKIKGPAIVLFNHGSFFDFIYALNTFKKNHLNFMVARMYFYNRFLAKALRWGGMFPKSMLVADIENVKNAMRVLNDGGVLAFMPEARLSTAGEFEDIQPSTVKFIKKMGVPVYTVRINGSYFAKPKWGKRFRKGSLVEAEFSTLAKGEELASMSEEELLIALKKAIGYNDFEWLKTRPKVKYKSRRIAEGLENILYKCPSCNSELTITTKGKTLTCSCCGLKASVNNRYAFENNIPFENFQEWYRWQTNALEQEILSNPDYNLTESVELYHGGKDGKKLVEKVGNGVCTLDRNGLKYIGTDRGEKIEKHFPMTVMYRLLFGAGENFEIYEGREIYYFVPNDKRSCVKWYMASKILKTLSEKN